MAVCNGGPAFSTLMTMHAARYDKPDWQARRFAPREHLLARSFERRRADMTMPACSRFYAEVRTNMSAAKATSNNSTTASATRKPASVNIEKLSRPTLMPR